MLNNKSVLITGGTGSFGKKFVETILRDYPQVKKIVIYSRDELKQFELKQKYPESIYPQLRFFIGDVRDGERLKRACEGIDVIIHAAAIKQVDTAEYNPEECIKTNVHGAQNVINAALQTGVKHVVALSTDKACAPINLYGATKLTSDKLFVAANNIKGARELKFSVVRYGNVMGSRGSVIPFFINKRDSGAKELPITDMRMTRFNISLQAGVDLVMYAIGHHLGGEIFIPKIPSYHIADVARAIAPELPLKEIGIRPGEKLHEEMITPTDALNTIDLGPYYAILPSVSDRYTNEDFVKYFLTESKEGYCTYFATAAVLMYRCAGIPARYVEGYVAADDTIKSGVPIQTTQTRKTSDNVQTEENVVEYQVDLKDNAAHAWAEVYMDGYGWVTVEVTPSASAQGSTGAATEAGASSGEGQNIQQELQTESPSEVSTDGQELTQDAAVQPLEQQTDSVPEISQGAAGEADNTAQDDSSAGSTHVGKAQTESAFTRLVKQYPLLWIPIGLILLFTVMSAIILIRYFTVRQMRTAKKRKTDIKSMVQEERREMVMEAYRSFEKMLAAAGYGRTSGLEYEAYAGYLTEASEIFKENHIKRIFDLVLRCSFSEIPVSEQEYRGYRRDMQNIRNAIEQKLGFWERLYFKYIRLF